MYKKIYLKSNIEIIVYRQIESFDTFKNGSQFFIDERNCRRCTHERMEYSKNTQPWSIMVVLGYASKRARAISTR